MSGLAPIPVFDIAGFCRRIVIAAIEGCADLSEKKDRIMVARECGFLSDEETEDWIVLGGMVEV